MVPRDKWGFFSVKSSYGFIERQEDSDFKWMDILRINASYKILFYVWTVIKDRIPTLGFLQKRVLILPNACLFCLGDVESSSHIMLRCPLAGEVWSSVLFEANVMWVLAAFPYLFQQ